MLSKAEQKRIRALQRKKGRQQSGHCLVEGEKAIELAGDFVMQTFQQEDLETEHEFRALVTTDTPPKVAAVAKIPIWTQEDVLSRNTVVVLDHVQDPGNVGTIARLCMAFQCSLILVDSVSITAPKVIRSSTGAVFYVPWLELSAEEARTFIETHARPTYLLQKSETAVGLQELPNEPMFCIAGNEGSGIRQFKNGTSLTIDHDSALDSLNVATALAIVLHARY